MCSKLNAKTEITSNALGILYYDIYIILTYTKYLHITDEFYLPLISWSATAWVVGINIESEMSNICNGLKLCSYILNNDAWILLIDRCICFPRKESIFDNILNMKSKSRYHWEKILIEDNIS